MLETGILLLFLVPGLAAYASIYGLFHSGKTIAPEPPAANTIEAVIVIAGASVVVHLLCAGAFTLNGALFSTHYLLSVPPAWLDPYRSALAAVAGKGIGGTALGLALAAVSVQGATTYSAARLWLNGLARRDRLPAWIYGWSAQLANAADNADTAIVAHILTTTDVDAAAVAYGGLLYDLALRPDGAITRITLVEVERYLVDLAAPRDRPSLTDALSQLSFIILDDANIRNVAFEVVDLPQLASSTASAG